MSVDDLVSDPVAQADYVAGAIEGGTDDSSFDFPEVSCEKGSYEFFYCLAYSAISPVNGNVAESDVPHTFLANLNWDTGEVVVTYRGNRGDPSFETCDLNPDLCREQLQSGERLSERSDEVLPGED